MQRWACLDGLRGALACYVMASHMAPFAVMPHDLASLLSHGGAAVDVFFTLSGLVIVRSLEATGWRARPFLIGRVARIFPAYLPMLALAMAVQPLPNGFEAMPWIGPDSPARSIWSDGWPRAWGAELLAHLTMTHGLFPVGVLPDAWVSFLGAAWSLSTEWQFYVLVLAAGWVALPRSTGSLWPLVAGFMALGLAGLCWRNAAPPDWQFSRAFLPNKAHYFALGIASAGLLGGGGWRGYGLALAATLGLSGAGGLEKLVPPLLWTLCLAAEHGCAGFMPLRAGLAWSRSGAVHERVPVGIARSMPGDNAASDIAGRPALLAPASSSPGIDPAISSDTRPPQPEQTYRTNLPALVLGLVRDVLSSRVMVWFGGLSYAIYLTNEPVQKLLGVALARIVGGDGRLFTLLWCPLALVLPVALATILHRWIELPAMQWGRSLTRHEHPRPYLQGAQPDGHPASRDQALARAAP